MRGGTSEVDYAPMAALLEGLSDVGTPNDYSVPTALGHDVMHAAPMRLDFALASSSLMWRYASLQAAMVKNDNTSSLSDHYPLEITAGPA